LDRCRRPSKLNGCAIGNPDALRPDCATSVAPQREQRMGRRQPTPPRDALDGIALGLGTLQGCGEGSEGLWYQPEPRESARNDGRSRFGSMPCAQGVGGAGRRNGYPTASAEWAE